MQNVDTYLSRHSKPMVSHGPLHGKQTVAGRGLALTFTIPENRRTRSGSRAASPRVCAGREDKGVYRVENIIVALVVILALAAAARTLYLQVTGRSKACACGRTCAGRSGEEAGDGAESCHSNCST